MDTLELPCDLVWEDNQTPLSPTQFSNASAEEILIFEDSFANGMN